MIKTNIEDKTMNLTDFDTSKFKLGSLCKRGHDYEGTGMSLRVVKNGTCLECERERSKKRYEKNKDYHREYCKNNSDRRKEYYEKNREHYSQYQKKYRADNKERLAKCKKEYYEETREYWRQYHKKYRADNKERLAKCRKEYYEENKESIGKYKKSWRIANPDKVRHRSEIRRVKIKRQSDGSITTERVKKLIASATKCPYCLKKMAHEEKVADHIIPVFRGGLNSIYNLVICCNNCNVRKNARSYPEWLDCLEPEQRKSAERLYYKRYGVSPLQGHLPLVFEQEGKSMNEQETWEETPDDVITTGSNQVMSHQERYEFVKNRVYYPVKPSKMVTYDSEADAIYIYLKDSKVVESEAISPSVTLDYDKDGDVVGVEILSFLSKLSQAEPIKKEDIGIWLRSLLD